MVIAWYVWFLPKWTLRDFSARKIPLVTLFETLLSRSFPFFDVWSYFMENQFRLFPPRLLWTFFGPLFLGASTVSACRLIDGSWFPTCAFSPPFQPRTPTSSLLWRRRIPKCRVLRAGEKERRCGKLACATFIFNSATVAINQCQEHVPTKLTSKFLKYDGVMTIT